MTSTAITPAGRGAATKARADGRAAPKALGAHGATAKRTVQAASTKAAPARVASAKAATARVASAKAATARVASTKAPDGGAATSRARTAGHRSRLRHETAPRAPRRVSGPLGAVTRGRAVPGTPRRADRAMPRRPSAPAPARRGSPRARVAMFVRSLPDHALLDRVIRGRAWIPLLGVLLAGIVGMQVEVLKLGASMGRSLERSTALQSRNELLQASVATLADDRRIERLAAAMGMVMPAPDAVNFLAARPVANVQPVIAGIHQPDASAFTAQLPVGTTAGTTTPPAAPVVSTDSSGTTTGASGDSTAASSTNDSAVTPTGG